MSIEPLLLLVVGAWLFGSIGVSESPTVSRTMAGVLGAGLVVIGWAVIIWTFFSWPSIFAGHGVLRGHRLITTGAYGVVRHPVYLGAILIWVGLALAFTHVVTFALAGLYVIPTYVLYLRSEEAMMLASFGDQYRDYRRRVPVRKKGGGLVDAPGRWLIGAKGEADRVFLPNFSARCVDLF